MKGVHCVPLIYCDGEVDQREARLLKTQSQSPEDNNGEDVANDDDGYLKCEDDDECNGGWA